MIAQRIGGHPGEPGLRLSLQEISLQACHKSISPIATCAVRWRNAYHPNEVKSGPRIDLVSFGSLLSLMLLPGIVIGHCKTPKPPTELGASSSHYSHPNASVSISAIDFWSLNHTPPSQFKGIWEYQFDLRMRMEKLIF